jgi:tRNA(Phe) wybutosine-synthesizing methylase Tyw3
VYEVISSLRPYFFSLREIDKNVSLDVKIPNKWRIENVQYVVSQYKSVAIKVQDKNDKFQLVSLIAVANEDGYETARICAMEIIKYNVELEEKERLFKEKVKELELLFKKESLDKLKDINFLEEDGQENTTGIRLVEQGNGEGQSGSEEPQDEDDK